MARKAFREMLDAKGIGTGVSYEALHLCTQRLFIQKTSIGCGCQQQAVQGFSGRRVFRVCKRKAI